MCQVVPILHLAYQNMHKHSVAVAPFSLFGNCCHSGMDCQGVGSLLHFFGPQSQAANSVRRRRIFRQLILRILKQQRRPQQPCHRHRPIGFHCVVMQLLLLSQYFFVLKSICSLTAFLLSKIGWHFVSCMQKKC
jgi:hypothetical protein